MFSHHVHIYINIIGEVGGIHLERKESGIL